MGEPLSTIALVTAAVAAVGGTTYAVISGEQTKKDRQNALDEQREAQQKAEAAANAEAARREEELKLQKEQMAAEAAERQRLIDERKTLLADNATTNLRTARRSLLATAGSVWESRASTKQRSLLGNSPVQGKTLLGQ